MSGLVSGLLGGLVGNLLDSLLGSNGYGGGLLGGNSLLSGVLGGNDATGQGLVSNLGLDALVNPYATETASTSPTLLGGLLGDSGLSLLGNGTVLGGNLLSPSTGLLGNLVSFL